MSEKKGKPELSIAIPFYNEEENAKTVVKDLVSVLGKAGIGFEIIAVDNGSVDATTRILDSLQSDKVKVIHVKKNKGFGNGILQAWQVARGNCLGYTCGDNEVSANSVVEIFNKLREQDLDLCKGRRVSRGYGLFRRLESMAYNRLFCPLFLGYRLGDINGYPKIMTKDCYKALKLSYMDSFFDTEIMVKAVRKGFRIGDVAVKYRKRKKGMSSVKFYIALEFLKNLIKFRIGLLLGKY